jgi:hypothetical protein
MSIRNLIRGLFTLVLLAVAAVASAEAPAWAPNLSAGFRTAKAEGKALVVVFTKECEPNCSCSKFLADKTLEHKGLERYASKAVFVHANPDRDDSFGNVKLLMDQLKIDAAPTTVVLKVKDGGLSEVGRVRGRYDTTRWLLRFSTACASLEGPQPAGKLTLEGVEARLADLGFSPYARTERTLHYQHSSGYYSVAFNESGDKFQLQTAVVGDVHPQLKLADLAKATGFPAHWFEIGEGRVTMTVNISVGRETPTTFVGMLIGFIETHFKIVKAMEAAGK